MAQRCRGRRDGNAAGGGPGIVRPGLLPCRFTLFPRHALHHGREPAHAGGMAHLHDVQGRRQHGQAPRQRTATQTPGQARPVRATHHQRGTVQALGLRHQGQSRVIAGQHGRRGAQLRGQLEHRQDAVPLRRGQALQARCFHIGHMPAHIELPGQPGGGANGLLGPFARADAGQDRP